MAKQLQGHDTLYGIHLVRDVVSVSTFETQTNISP